MAGMAIIDDITLDELEDDPYPAYARLRREAPVAWISAANVWFVTRFDECELVGMGREGFVGAKDHPTLQRVFGSPNVLTSGGETHRQLRAGVDPRLQPKPINDTIDDLVRPMARQYLAPMRQRKGGDLMADYLEPVSVEALRSVMGLADLVDSATLRRWFHDLNVGISNFGLEPEGFAIADAASAEIDKVVRPKLEHLVAHPDDSMLSHMLWAGREEGAGPRPFEFIMPSLRVILLGGMQEPGHAAGSTLLGLFSQPQQWARLVANPADSIPLAINEGLRWIAPIGSVERQASRDVVLHGQRIPEGSIVQVVLASANRDERRFEDPDRFDMDRGGSHQAFGNGAHFCAGHFFARQVERIMFEEMIEALPGLRPDTSQQPVVTGWVFRAPKYFPVLWDKAPAIEHLGNVRIDQSRSSPVVVPDHDEGTTVLEVRAMRVEAEGILSLELVDPRGAPLPAWEPGAHIDLWLTEHRAGQYSLCGDPTAASWTVAVYREPESRGVSSFVHERLRPGMRLHVGGPRNNFALEPAGRYTFIAGGIGITPMLPMLSAASANNADVEVVYCGRSRRSMAFLDRLAATGAKLSVHARDEGPRVGLGAVVARAASEGRALYVCGTTSMLHAIEDAAAAHGIDVVTEHFEGGEAHRAGDQAFDVVLARSGRRLTIPADRSVIEVLDDEGISIRRSCQEGNCGSCETRVLSGEVDHRDVLLTRKQRATNDRMMLCVSRAKNPDEPLVLDL